MAYRTVADVATCLAVYGWDKTTHTSQWPLIARAVQTALGVRFSEGYWTRDGRESRHGNLDIVEKTALRGGIHGLTYLLRPHGPFHASDWEACFTLSAYPSELAFVGVKRTEDILGFVAAMLRALGALGKPFYGIGYKRSMGLGPEAFAFGMNYSVGAHTIPTDEADRSSRWLFDITSGRSPAPRRFRAGYFRDVYPVNVLSSEHLALPIAGITFQDWVSSSAGFGRLSFLDSACLWCLDDPSIPEARRVLEENRLLVGPQAMTIAQA